MTDVNVAMGVWSMWTLAHTGVNGDPIVKDVVTRVKYFYVVTLVLNVRILLSLDDYSLTLLCIGHLFGPHRLPDLAHRLCAEAGRLGCTSSLRREPPWTSGEHHHRVW